eukprot:TRINITY_DN3487_c0_g4_i2.p2 TRINITY_DN3487_c0_g4~~TRINITY_DN3487_c0_g4_i2.p2  ORF type:complete len:109 (+),score=4.78 TRINITY_DN3487_c0_g4_i2:404-730(+)
MQFWKLDRSRHPEISLKNLANFFKLLNGPGYEQARNSAIPLCTRPSLQDQHFPLCHEIGTSSKYFTLRLHPIHVQCGFYGHSARNLHRNNCISDKDHHQMETGKTIYI